MADNKLHITAALIRQYLEGKLDDRTMHAIERQALDDPFLAEALEGYARQNADQRPALADLQSRLEKRVQPPKSGGILRKMEYRWLAAASVLILLCITAVMLMNRTGRKDVDIVQADPLKKEDTAVTRAEEKDTAVPRPMPPGEQTPAHQPTQTTAPDLAQASEQQPEQSAAKKQAAAKKTPPPAPVRTDEKQEAADLAGLNTARQQEAADLARANAARQQEAAKAARVNTARQEAAADIARANAAPSVMAKQPRKIDTIMIRGISSVRDSQQLIAKEGEKVEGYISGEPSKYSNAHTDENVRLISGVVIDEKTGSRLPGVIVSLSGTNRGVITDTAGGFALQVDKKEKVNLAFSYIGYERKNVTVAQNTSKVNVALPANDAALNDVVVVGYGGKAKKPVIPPSPAIGEDAYQAYLQSKKIIPVEGNITPVSGEVHISFTVMPDSTLRNFRVIRSLSREADKAAINIVKEGPKWKPAAGKRRGTAEVKVPIVIQQRP
ncbi:carboxypeptidase-like regulatory domain-containing protein [Chitinophaga cymbidii]|uniref:TonB C-terminal domain-containing protein n=1 Tax=Chitinophaga cymbidii TaxID=1096750 RepID=A0A512RI00_9BACT|nr:carboxypeptidase-like regulatory domain-containing protein [Chitinophaga cymbidii]GEP95301.1 hypothetical protein CCY01nite_15610 [Chitinophaga cymbidii]